MEQVELFNKIYVVKEKKNGVLELIPVTPPTDHRNALTEYTDQELVNEMWRRADEWAKKRKEGKDYYAVD